MPMTPGIRAAADRFILDTAHVKHVATSLPPGGLEREVEGFGWTVRQLLAHLATNQERYAIRLAEVAAGQPTTGDRDRADRDRRNDQAARRARRTPSREIVRQLDQALVRIVSALDALSPEAADGNLGDRPLVERVTAWSKHCAEHGIDLIDTLPELRFDPLVLNWLLYVDYTGDAAREARQHQLLEDLREHYDREDAATADNPAAGTGENDDA
ncbi:MAG TPA: maleylpyruvate isomerase N-terminal domain-containing protein [Tepidiformaceae bacterium]|nr:maleylpyruvate isomerase N-terminal domain-containing protein [Tepidiformaceae bacterium]